MSQTQSGPFKTFDQFLAQYFPKANPKVQKAGRNCMSIDNDIYSLRDYGDVTVVNSKFGDIVIVASHTDDKNRHLAGELDMDGEQPGFIRLWLKDSPEDGEGNQVEAYLQPEDARLIANALLGLASEAT